MSMSSSPTVVAAVEAAIVASAHGAALEQTTTAAIACQRLGRLSSGRWRSAGRDLENLADELQRSFGDVVEVMIRRATELGVPEETLWTVGDAAGTFDLLRDAALDEVSDDDELVTRVLDADILFGVSFAEDPEVPDRGTTLLFGWPAPLAAVSWPWQANWVLGDEHVDAGDELDLYEQGDMTGEDVLIPALTEALSCTDEQAREALSSIALAFTRASLLAASGSDEEYEEDDDDDENGH